MYRCIVFDFDGTLVDSNAVKRHAYFDIFRAEARPHIEAVLRERMYANRIVMIEEILRRITGTSPAAAEVERFAVAYNDICESHQATCPERPGAGATLLRLARRAPLYLCSGTLEEPLRRVVARRGWQGYFREVFGSPRTKVENLERIARHVGCPPDAILAVGDTNDDLHAARAGGFAFAGIASDATDFEAGGVRMIHALADLEAMC